MARSFSAAFGDLDEAELDRVLGLVDPPRTHAPVDREVAAAFEGFDYKPMADIAGWLSWRYRCHRGHGEEAVQDAWLYLFSRRPELFRGAPEGWLRPLRYVARFRLLRARASDRRAESIESLVDAAGDAALDGARPCVAPSFGVGESCRHLLPPRQGESWTRAQVIGALQRYRDYHDRIPRIDDCRAVNLLPSATTVYRHFDRFADALLAAGIVPDALGRRQRAWEPLEAASACVSFRRRNGRWPDLFDAEDSAGALPGRAAMIRFFGGTRAGEVQQGAEAILAGAGVPPV